MAHSTHHLYAHVVFATAHRYPYLTGELEAACHQCLREALIECDVYPIVMDGLSDHIHLLMKYKSNASISDIVKHIKGKSSYQLNYIGKMPIPFKWCRGYFAVSVSPRDVSKISCYIQDQKKTSQSEYEAWVARHFGPVL